ncbi:flagellar hook-length control protein FliK [Vampirovibrio sp.]|uniref:flagellar hook-length control protein FliK n=1 Tax=Vampirovibrio sp. TaxID=2717857 RepID=UPI003594567C
MKIEDSPFQFSSPVEKLRRNTAPSSFDSALDELDMSFLDLLGSISATAKGNVDQARLNAQEETSEGKAGRRSGVSESKKVVSLPVETKVSEPEEESSSSYIDDDMYLSREDLSLLDIQYLKQEVIPALPILVGNVPFNTVFPKAADGEMSYKGFDISPKLAELIEKGYKTGRPIRVDLDANSALVLKIRNGQVSAEYVSADKAAAFVIQQELDELRNRMAARQLPVGSLEYKYQNPGQHRQQSDQDSSSEKNER